MRSFVRHARPPITSASMPNQPARAARSRIASTRTGTGIACAAASKRDVRPSPAHSRARMSRARAANASNGSGLTVRKPDTHDRGNHAPLQAFGVVGLAGRDGNLDRRRKLCGRIAGEPVQRDAEPVGELEDARGRARQLAPVDRQREGIGRNADHVERCVGSHLDRAPNRSVICACP